MKVAIIGAGNMGGAMARGLAKGSLVNTSDITVSNPSREKLDILTSEFPKIITTQSNKQAVAGADAVILAVKPWLVQDVIEEIKGELDYDNQAVLSMAGGIGTARLCQYLDRGDGEYPAVYYLIPNMAIAVMSGMTFMSSVCSTPELDARVLAMFKELGDAMLVEERLMEAGMALASCGIAYAMRYIRAATEGGVELGFSPKDARRAIAQTLKGAVELLAAGDAHPEAEIDKVTTPGGLTIRGLNAMEETGFTASVIKGLRASVKK
ncbi:MAG: pyrroline-5-carboxylate reductase [Paraprevotella sp.]|nr:pyrroline-5-carboxylate reductase [Paraprevotella sp.]